MILQHRDSVNTLMMEHNHTNHTETVNTLMMEHSHAHSSSTMLSMVLQHRDSVNTLMEHRHTNSSRSGHSGTCSLELLRNPTL